MANYVRFRRADGSTGAGLLGGENIAVIKEPFWEAAEQTGESVSLSSVTLLPPTEPRSIVCVGLNYASHLNGRPVPDPPTLFFKPLSSIAGPGDDIVMPEGAGRIDPEGEIVIVIGKKVSRANREEALDAIFGYTCGNDVSAREWQRADGQWWRAKGSDTFGIYGPDIVTAISAGLKNTFAATSHHVSNVLVEFKGPSIALSKSYVYAWHRYQKRPEIGYLWGQYSHDFRLEEGMWKIARLKLRAIAIQDFHRSTMHPVERLS